MTDASTSIKKNQHKEESFGGELQILDKAGIIRPDRVRSNLNRIRTPNTKIP
jgi:hypothetical protein